METTGVITINIGFSRRSSVLLLVLFFIAWHPGFLGSETLTLTTYYPAPYGGYVSILTTGGVAGGAAVNTLLVRDNGNLGIGTGVPASKVDIRLANGAVDGVQVSDDNTNPDTRSYASFGVTRVNSASNLAYIGMTKAGIYPWAIGVSGVGSSFIIGASQAGTRTIPTPVFSVSPAGDATVSRDLYVNGYVQGLCYRKRYVMGTTSCDNPNERVLTWYGDDTKKICGMLFTGGGIENPLNWTSQVCVGGDKTGSMLCCRVAFP